MGCIGVYFAISPDEMKRLLLAGSHDELLENISDNIEEELFGSEWCYEVDKSWDALHRCLGDGTLNLKENPSPLAATVFSGELLNQEDDYYVSLIRPENVRATAEALAEVTREWLRSRYDAIDADDYDVKKSDDDFEYTWSWFEKLPDFFDQAANARRAVIFTVDQ